MDDEDYLKARDKVRIDFGEWLSVQAAERAVSAIVEFEHLAAYCVNPAHVLMTQAGAETMATCAEAAAKTAEGIRRVLFQYGFATPPGTVGTGATITGFPFKE